jgi:hypothetical protein
MWGADPTLFASGVDRDLPLEITRQWFCSVQFKKLGRQTAFPFIGKFFRKKGRQSAMQIGAVEK